MKRRIGFGMMQIMEAHLISVGSGPTLDFESADAFLAEFVEPIELARRRRYN